MIKPPFANYPRARLERLVRERFEEIEYRAARTEPNWAAHEHPIISHGEFQILVAADAYLRTTQGETE